MSATNNASTQNNPAVNYWEDLPVQNITAGPSKMDFMMSYIYAFQDRENKRDSFKVCFTADDGKKYTVTVEAQGHEDGSGESFNFFGKVHRRSETIVKGFEMKIPCWGYYNTKTRKGWLCVAELGKTYVSRECVLF